MHRRSRVDVEVLERRVFLSSAPAAGGGADYPGAIWTPAGSGDYSTGQSNPRWIIIHTTEETAAATITEFTTPNLQVSANYLVTLTGAVYQFVHNDNVAYDAGNLAYNIDSIGVENERYGTHNATEAEYEADAALVRYLAAEYNIPLVHYAGAVAPANPADATGIIGHYQVPDPTNPTLGGGISHHTDPVNWNWSHYMSLVEGVTAPDIPTNISPAANATNVPLTATLTASSFVDLDPGSTHAASEWVIRRTSDGTVVYDTGTDATHLTSLGVPAGVLANGTSYSWQVRYEDNYGNWSAFSTATTFSTPSLNTAAIAGTVFTDANEDQVRDGGEAGLAGVTVYLDANNDGNLDNGEVSTVTDGVGNFSFVGLPAGNYVIRQVLPAGEIQTGPANDAGIPITLTAGQRSTGNTLGDIAAATISGTVFNDANGDRILDNHEAGLGGWIVYIALNNGLTYQSGDPTATTDSNGQFTFAGLLPGTYTLRVVPRSRWLQTFPAGNAGQQLLAAAGQNVTGVQFGERVAPRAPRPHYDP